MKKAIVLMLLAVTALSVAYVATQAESTSNYNVAGSGKGKRPPGK